MKTSLADGPLAETQADALVVGVYGQQLEGVAAELDAALGGAVGRLIEQQEFKGTPGEVTALLGHDPSPAPTTVLLGLGEREQLDPRTARQAAGAASLWLAAKPRDTVEFRLDLRDAPLERAAALGAMAGCRGCDIHRAERKLHSFSALRWHGLEASDLHRATAIGGGVQLAKTLVNQPASHIYPESFAHEAERVAGKFGLEIEVWDETQLQQQRCGSLLAVARGSSRPPRLVIVSHWGGGDGEPLLGLVGKGVTFDSGGLSLKPSDSMKAMKCDMAGAAAVLGAMEAIAMLNLPVNVIGVCGLVENLVSGDSYKLGDVLTARSGKTIEVLNTDAEGRLVLADALNVAVERGAAKLIDLATLTGACVVALGTETMGLMSNADDWCEAVASSARRAGERAWQLPMFPEYSEQIRSQVADIKNIGEGRWGGAITAAKFLEEFVDGTPWTHMDIAGPAFLDSGKPWHSAGGTGAGVATLVDVAEAWSG